MKLYAGTTEQFRTDAQMDRIADKLRTEYIATIRYQPGNTSRRLDAMLTGHSATSAENAVVVGGTG